MRKHLCIFAAMLGLIALRAVNAQADSATITATGVWGSGAPISDWSAPGDTWSLSLTLANPASAIAFNVSSEMQVTAIGSFSYALNGSPVNIAPSDVIFFPSYEFGGFDVDFTTAGIDTTNGITCSSTSVCSLNLFGDLLFSGTAPQITLHSGSVSTVDFDYTASGDDTNPAGTGVVSSFSVTPTATPEPATISLLALGALSLFLKRQRS
jgi:hypothetical protein